MKLNFLNKKIPTLVGLSLIVIGILFTTFLVEKDTIFEIAAGPDQIPQNVKISNITDDSFTVSYQTTEGVVGSINYGADQDTPNLLTLDDRDQITQVPTKRKTHSITAKNLSPQTTYYFSITSGDKIYLDGGSPYIIKTGSKIDKNPSTQNPASGKVKMPDGTIPNEGLVYVTIEGGQALSTFLKIDGTYTIPLNTIRNSSLNEYLNLNKNTILKIEVLSGNLSSSIDVSLDQINPVPTVSLSGNYDFIDSKTTPTKKATGSGGFFLKENKIKEVIEPKILTPQDDEEFIGQLPTFEGTALPGEVVTIEIHSNENLTEQITTDDNGNWSYTPQNYLSEGKHTITIKTINSKGVTRTITKTFSVPKAQGQVVENTTLTNSLTPNPTPILTSTNLSESISPAPTLLPTENSLVIIATIAGIIAGFSGIFLYLFARKNKSI